MIDPPAAFRQEVPLPVHRDRRDVRAVESLARPFRRHAKALAGG
ncbi:hypothetical protein [Azospirillum lipoferum]|uniref:Uncharacterized protein n=1 Tax=Azospirillum lipoferum (strain 4B) TaxID=862719 RepID=G7Z1P2_AZOL4|nr:hypothetical protein [Azospirillum lipoferum]CBS87162.1 protein of unknown function [Azospirillum lipoferum 4B]